MKKYVNLDLELFEYRREGGDERFRVRVAGSPAGEMPLSEAVACALPRGLRASIQALEDDRLERAELIELGGRLSEQLLPAGPVNQLFKLSLGLLDADQGLRLRLRVEAPELASLPWELSYMSLPGARAGEQDARGFLGLQRRLSLVRHELLPTPVEKFSEVPKPRLVCLLSAAQLPGLPVLDLGREQRDIRAAVGSAGIQMVALTSATLAKLQSALDGEAQLFHYAGHGLFDERMGEVPRTSEGEGYLLFEDANGSPLEVPAEQVGGNLAAANVRLAVLNGCETGRRDAAHSWTGIAPVLAQQGVPAVLANQFKVSDEAAIELSRRFYEKLATGEPIDAAVTAARLALSNLPSARPRDFATLVLYLRLADDSDGVLLPRAPADSNDLTLNRWFWINLALLVGLTVGIVPWLTSRYLGWDLLAGSGAGVVTLCAAWALVDRLAGEQINTTLRAWLSRPMAAVWLWVLLAFGGLAAILAPRPEVMVLLMPFDGLVTRLPAEAQESQCSLRLTVNGAVQNPISGLWRQAVFLATNEQAVAQLAAQGALTKSLLVMRPTKGLEEQRRRFYDKLIDRRRIEPFRLDSDDRLRVEILERSRVGTESVIFDAESRVSELDEGETVRVWFLKGGPP